MIESGCRFGLLDKPPDAVDVFCYLRLQYLERDVPLEREIARQEHDPHSASAELALDRVPSGDGALEREDVGGRFRSIHARAPR